MHFVMDHNFPHQGTSLPWPPSIQITRLKDLDPSLIAEHDDWEIFRALQQRGGIDAFITNDAKILNLTREMVVLSLSQLVLVVTDGVGQDAVRATGLLMLDLDQVARQMADPSSKRPLIYRLYPGPVRSSTVGDQISRLAKRERIGWQELVERETRATSAS